MINRVRKFWLLLLLVLLLAPAAQGQNANFLVRVEGDGTEAFPTSLHGTFAAALSTGDGCINNGCEACYERDDIPAFNAALGLTALPGHQYVVRGFFTANAQVKKVVLHHDDVDTDIAATTPEGDATVTVVDTLPHSVTLVFGSGAANLANVTEACNTTTTTTMPCDGLDLIFPAGPSPKVFTTGWTFGARAFEGAVDHASEVSWSGSGTFAPGKGARSVPTFAAKGANTIVLTAELNGQTCTKTFVVSAVSPRGYAAAGGKAMAPADAHGCPSDPVPVVGFLLGGSANISIGGRPAVRVGDGGPHAACCGPNLFQVLSANNSDVVIDGLPAARIGDPTQHCGGIGLITSAAPAPAIAADSEAGLLSTGSGTISGHVADSLGGAITGVGVTAFGLANIGAWGTITDENGNYQIDSLPADKFAVYFWGGNTSYNVGFASSWYDGRANIEAANRVTVAAGATVSGIDATLAQAGAIEGHVTDPGSNPLADVIVLAFSETTGASWALTDDTGNYEIAGLASGSYRVECRAAAAGFVDEWFNDKSSKDAADLVSVTAPAHATADCQLAVGGSISGKVTDTQNGAIEDVWVHALGANGATGSQSTSADGTYHVTGLPAGTYVVRFDGSSVGFAQEWYANAPTWDAAVTVPVTSGQETGGIDADLVANSGGLPGCGDAVSDASIKASDALYILRVAVGTKACNLCVCDVNSSGKVTAGDALPTLQKSVGQPVVLTCPGC